MAPRKQATMSTKVTARKAASNPIKARKEKIDKPCKPIFKGFTFSFSGSFTAFDENWDHDSMIRWIKCWGGAYESQVSNDTTHLICTIEDYKKKTDQVRKAWAQGPACYTLIPEWLYDSLLGKTKRAINEKPYTLDRVLKRVHNSVEKQQEYRDSFDKGKKAARELVDSERYHIYYDYTGFEYKIVCTRINDSGKVKVEKYTIYLFASHAQPSLYMVGAKFCRGAGRSASYWREECKPKIFKDAFEDFKGFFRSKTGINWDDRCDGLSSKPEKFTYLPPTLGRPVGLLPDGKMPAGFHTGNEPDGEDSEMTDIPDGLIYDTDSDAEEEDSDITATPSSKHSFYVRAPVSPISISSDSGSGCGSEPNERYGIIPPSQSLTPSERSTSGCCILS